MSTRMNELGFYALAGAPGSPRELLQECADAEALGLGSAFLSERFNVKEAATVCGALAAATTTLGIGTGVTNHNTRHPMVTAAHATTMHRLTGGRYMLGIGRGIKPQLRAFGLAPIRTAEMEEFARLMRRLWKGDRITDYDGPLGKFPALQLDPAFDEDIPLGITAFAPQTLELAGRAFDAVLLHTFFADETLVRVVKTVKEAAERAGRSPDHVRVWSVFATIGDHLPPALRLKKTVGRLATYLQVYGDLLVDTNRWDPEPLKRFREDPFVAGFQGWFDQKATTEDLERIAPLIPEAWLAPAATGSAEDCARKVLGQLDLGADGVILHGASPAELRPIVEAYREIRPAARFDRCVANPGGRPST